MIIGFSRHGTGGGRAPVDYLTSEVRAGRENAAPVVLRGSPDDTAALIDSLEFKHRYTSGVLSFAPEDNVTPAQEQAIMDRFEQVAFAGLEADRYNILWVRHAHAGHHELHFVTPRVELETGKSLNIRPPGEATKVVFDDLRSEINARYGYADPDDPDRVRDVAVPGHVLKIAAEALRRGEKPEGDVRVLIDAVLSQRAAQGVIRNRSDLVDQVSDLGLAVTREGKDYITVSEPESGQRWRLKGTLYEREFTAGRAVEAAESRRERQFCIPDAGAAERFAQRVERHIAGRAEYNTARYENANRSLSRRVRREPERIALAAGDRPDAHSVAECADALGDYLSVRLGRDSILRPADTGAAPSGVRDGYSGPHAGAAGWPDENEHVRRAAVRPDRPGLGGIREPGRELPDSEGVLNDGAGNALVDRIEKFAGRAKRAVESLRTGAARFTEHVRAYCSGQRAVKSAGDELAGAGERLNAAAPALWEPVRAEQAIARHRQEEQQRLLEAQRQRQEQERQSRQRQYHGPSM